MASRLSNGNRVSAFAQRDCLYRISYWAPSMSIKPIWASWPFLIMGVNLLPKVGGARRGTVWARATSLSAPHPGEVPPTICNKFAPSPKNANRRKKQIFDTAS